MTEKQYAPTKTEKKVSQKVETPKKSEELKKALPKQKEKIDEDKKETNEKSEKKEKKKPEVKKVIKEEVSINAQNVHISSKKSFAICKFIKGKTIEKAIEDLEKVLDKKIAVPMKGEIPHKKSVKGVASGSGRYPQNATKEFIVLLKSLQGNANNHDVDEPVIVEAVANFGDRPLGRFGRWQRKRTHIKIKARSKKKKSVNKNKEEKK